MILRMPGPWKHPDSGVWYLRRRVPNDLAAAIGRSTVKKSLATRDPATAREKFTKANAELEAQWAKLRNKLRCSPKLTTEIEAKSEQRQLSEREAQERAVWMYEYWLSRYREYPSRQRFWPTDLYKYLWRPSLFFECRQNGPADSPAELNIVQGMKVRELEAWCRDEAETVLFVNDIVANDENILRVAKAIATQIQRASLTLAALAQGEPEPARSSGCTTAAAKPPTVKPISLSALVEAWWREAERTGKSPSTRESYTNTMRLLVDFLGHDDAHRVTTEDIIRFKDYRLASSKRNGKLISATTVKNSDLAGLKSVFSWAVANRRLVANPAAAVRVSNVAKTKLREREFSDEEACTLLRAALELQQGREQPQTFAAKRWIPWLLAFTGARVGEIAQLRRQDLRYMKTEDYPDGLWILRITPEAGTVKTKEAREIPLHLQLVALGFPTFVGFQQNERLFLSPNLQGKIEGKLQALKNRLAEFARGYVADPGVSPNHSWRHRFRTVATEAGVSSNVIDAICGWAAKNVGERYGSISLKARADAIRRLPWIKI
jgi:integrase